MDGIGRYAGIDWAKDAPRGLRHRRAGQRSSPASRWSTRRPACGSWSAGSRASTAWPSSDPTARSSTPCSRPACGRRHRQPPRQGAPDPPRPGRQQGRPRRRATSSPTPCAPTAIACGRSSPTADGDGGAAGDGAGTQGPGADPGGARPAAEAHLALVFPGAVDLFDDLASPIAQAFLLRFPSAERAAWLSPRRLDHWLAAQGYCGRRSGTELHARLVRGARGARAARPRSPWPR